VDTVAGVEKTRSYTYDGLDRLASETHADGFSAAYSFDDVGRRTAKSTAEFDVNYANGDGDRLAGWNVSRTNLAVSVAGHASEPIGTNAQIGMGQVYNSAGSATPTISGTNFTATLQAEALGTQTVVVLISDMAGNVGVTTNRHVLTAFTTGAYSGDAAGCVTQIVYQGNLCEQSRVLAWDAEYRLTSVKTNGATAETHTYDPYGRRISTTDADGAVTRYLNDGAHVLADLDATGGVLRTYFYGPNVDELLAMTVHTGVVVQTYYAIRDHQNTIWAWVNTNGAVVESYDFDAWGRLLSVTDGNGNAQKASAIGNRYLFQGREYSWTTGLYYFRARWYDPVTGRWLSPDPIGISGGLNQFVFCANNPVNAVDPDGLATYWQNRTLGGNTLKSNYNILSHSYLFTTNPDGTLNHTYSWGNAANTHTWHMDQPEDIAAAQAALKNPKGLEKRGCDELDPYVDQVYNDWVNDPAHIHRNYGVAGNCKFEATGMLNEANRRMNAANAARAAEANAIMNSVMGSSGFPF
jgi:RHS repeat-associated protein